MRKFFNTVIDGVHYLFVGGDEKEHNAIPLKEKYRTVIIWIIVLAFCITMLKLLLH
jgi:hypothetical protein